MRLLFTLLLTLMAFELHPVCATAEEVKIACVDGISKADPSKQASLAVGTIVGFVTGGLASGGDPLIIITGTYVGCETGKAFAEAFKSDGDKAMVLLNPYMFAFVKTHVGQTVIVFAGNIGKQTQDEMRMIAENGAKTENPLEATFLCCCNT